MTPEEREVARHAAQKRWREKNPEYYKKYKDKNREHINKMNAVYRVRNRERCIAATERCRLADKEKKNASQRRWYHANKDKAHSVWGAWRSKNRAKVNAYAAKYVALKHNAFVESVNLEQVVEIHGAKCYWCHSDKVRLEMDHVVALARGGAHELLNVVPACRSCNARKSNRSVKEFKIAMHRRRREADDTLA